MSYTPTSWNTGDTITAAAMNKIENGIASAEASGGYDAEVIVYHDNNSSHDYEFTIVSGSFASLAAKIADHIVPTVLFRIWDDMSIHYIVALGYLYNYMTIGNSQYMLFHAFQPFDSQGNGWGLAYINWSSNDEITV